MLVPLCLNSLISITNQDTFIQKAVNASRIYANIIMSIEEADTLARDANMKAMEVMLSLLWCVVCIIYVWSLSYVYKTFIINWLMTYCSHITALIYLELR